MNLISNNVQMFQVLLQRETDREGIRGGNYRVLDCFKVQIDLLSKQYKGRKVYRVAPAPFPDSLSPYGEPRCVAFFVGEVKRGSFVSLRRYLGKQYQKAGRK